MNRIRWCARWIHCGPFTLDAEGAGVTLAMTKMMQQIVCSQLSVVSCSHAARALASIAMTQMTKMTQVFHGRNAVFMADCSFAMRKERA
jgi:hypothetical protein